VFGILLVIFGPKSEPGEQQQKMPTRVILSMATRQYGNRRSATVFVATLGVRPQQEATGSRLRQSESDGPARMSVGYWLMMTVRVDAPKKLISSSVTPFQIYDRLSHENFVYSTESTRGRVIYRALEELVIFVGPCYPPVRESERPAPPRGSSHLPYDLSFCWVDLHSKKLKARQSPTAVTTTRCCPEIPN
jgi:hypothetical protein